MSQGIGLLFIRLKRLLNAPRNWRINASRKERKRWDDAANWYRLRYEDAARAQEMLVRLSEAGERVALRIRYDDMLRCWIGVPARFDSVLHRVTESFGCQLAKESPPNVLGGMFFPATAVPGAESADAYVVNGVLFVSQRRGGRGDVFPAIKKESVANNTKWTMPEPSLGITTRAHVDLPAPPTLFRHEGDWLLGWDKEGHSVGCRQTGVLGDPGQVHHWLSSFLLTTWKNEGAQDPVVVIDGQGAWLDQFLKDPVAQSMFTSRMVRVLDIRSHQLAFNPLVWAESGEKATAIRWFWWFKGMGIPESALKSIIPLAIQSGIQNIPELYTWLTRQKTANPQAVVPMMDKIERLDADPAVREWLLATERFADVRQIALHAPLLVTPRLQQKDGHLWARQQALRALLGLVVEADVSIVLHQVHQLSKTDRALLKNKKLVVTNSPGSDTTVVTRCQPDMARQIHARLGLAVAEEHLQLLPPGSSLVLHGKNGDSSVAAVSWRNSFV